MSAIPMRGVGHGSRAAGQCPSLSTRVRSLALWALAGPLSSHREAYGGLHGAPAETDWRPIRPLECLRDAV